MTDFKLFSEGCTWIPFFYCCIQGTARKGQFPETYRKGNHKSVAVITSRCRWDTRVVERDWPHKQQSGNSKTALFPGQIKTMLYLQYKALIWTKEENYLCIYSRVGLDDLDRSFPTQRILWFNDLSFDSVSGLVFHFRNCPKKCEDINPGYQHALSSIWCQTVKTRSSTTFTLARAVFYSTLLHNRTAAPVSLVKPLQT